MSKNKSRSLKDAVESGRLERYLSGYLKSCLPSPAADPKRDRGRFPNLAGFCRWLGCGLSELDSLRISFPDAHDYLCAVMEDEALNNAALSPTLATAYLKRRLGYAERSEGVSEATCGEMRVIFEHDISEDGA